MRNPHWRRTFFARRWRRPLVAVAVLIGAAINLRLAVDTAQAQSSATVGSWGKVLVVAGSENEPDNQQPSRAAVWDPQSGAIVVQDLLWDVFCNGMACLPDGRFLIVGGTTQYDPFYGEPRAMSFDPATAKFAQVIDLRRGIFVSASPRK